MKRILSLLIPLLLCICLAACAAGDKSVKAVITGNGAPLYGMEYPPALTVTGRHGEIQALTPTYAWTKPDGGSVETDGMFVFDLWLNGSLRPLAVTPNESVELRFDAVPDQIRVMTWKAECATEDRSRIGESVDLPVKEDTFRIPIGTISTSPSGRFPAGV